MTLREIFNAILDYSLQFNFELNPWAMLFGFVVALVVIVGLNMWLYYDKHNGGYG